MKVDSLHSSSKLDCSNFSLLQFSEIVLMVLSPAPSGTLAMISIVTLTSRTNHAHSDNLGAKRA